MKKMLYTACILSLALCLSSASAFAGFGAGAGTGTCPHLGYSQVILDGTPFDYEGTVVSIGTDMGMVIATDAGNVTVYGIGPIRFWNTRDVYRPAVGDIVAVSGYTVDFSGVERNIAMTITVDGTEVELRDPETARPLWAGGRKALQ